MDTWASTTDALANLFYQYGIFVMSLLLFLKAAGVPLPLPGDLLMLVIGSQLGQAGVPLWTAWSAFSVATFAGAMVLFLALRHFGRRSVSEYGHYVGLTSDRVAAAEDQIRRRGWWALTIGRMLPGVRLATAVAAATFDVATGTFASAAGVGAVLEVGACLIIGATIGPALAERFEHASLPLDGLVVTLVLAFAVVFVVRATFHLYRHHSRASVD
jgi:membrane protein DedA with SNARE-associated domain